MPYPRSKRRDVQNGMRTLNFYLIFSFFALSWEAWTTKLSINSNSDCKHGCLVRTRYQDRARQESKHTAPAQRMPHRNKTAVKKLLALEPG